SIVATNGQTGGAVRCPASVPMNAPTWCSMPIGAPPRFEAPTLPAAERVFDRTHEGLRALFSFNPNQGLRLTAWGCADNFIARFALMGGNMVADGVQARDYFISRTGSDKSIAVAIADVIREAGRTTWLQDEDFGH